MAWADVTPTTSEWTVTNPTATIWDGGATQWDLNGNVYTTLWDNIDNTWANQTGTSVIWTDV